MIQQKNIFITFAAANRRQRGFNSPFVWLHWFTTFAAFFLYLVQSVIIDAASLLIDGLYMFPLKHVAKIAKISIPSKLLHKKMHCFYII